MKKFLLLLIVFGFSFADELFIYKNKPAVYVQYEEFLVADGISVIGPVKLLPNAILKNLRVETGSKNIDIKAILIENTGKNWKESIIGKHISIEGQGRFIKGKVKSIDGKFIIIDSNRGTVITTLPDFPERITSVLKWDELFSPYIMVKVNSSFSGKSTFSFTYQIEGISWEPIYIYMEDKNLLEEYIQIQNNTNIDFQSMQLHIKDRGITVKKIKTTLEANSKKRIKINSYTVKNSIVSSKEKLINGKVFVYYGKEFKGLKYLRDNRIR